MFPKCPGRILQMEVQVWFHCVRGCRGQHTPKPFMAPFPFQDALILRTGGYHQRAGDRVNSPSHHVDPNLNLNVGFSTCALRVVEHCKITPLAPALFTLAQHAALCQASSALHSSERLLAFLDDLYVLITRERAREARDTVVQAVQEGCGIP